MQTNEQLTQMLYTDTAQKANLAERKALLKLVDKLLKNKCRQEDAKNLLIRLVASNPYMPSYSPPRVQFVEGIKNAAGISGWAEHLEGKNIIRFAQKLLDALTTKPGQNDQKLAAYNLVFALTVVGHEMQHFNQNILDGRLHREGSILTHLSGYQRSIFSSQEQNVLTLAEFEYVAKILELLGRVNLDGITAKELFDGLRIHMYLDQMDEVDAFINEERFATMMLNYIAADPVANKRVKLACQNAIDNNTPNLVSEFIVGNLKENAYTKFLNNIKTINPESLIEACKVLEVNIGNLPQDKQKTANSNYINAAAYIISKMTQAVCFEELEKMYRSALSYGCPILASSVVSAMSIYGKTEPEYRQKVGNFAAAELQNNPDKLVVDSLYYICKFMPDSQLCQTAAALAQAGQTQHASNLLNIINLKINYDTKYGRTKEMLYLSDEYTKIYSNYLCEDQEVKDIIQMLDDLQTELSTKAPNGEDTLPQPGQN